MKKTLIASLIFIVGAVTAVAGGFPPAYGPAPASIAEYNEIQMIPFDFGTSLAVGDGAFYVHIGTKHGGKSLTYAHAEVITAGTTGVATIDVYNVTQATSMLSTLITIDTAETGSDQAATPAVIASDGSEDVTLYDLIRIDIDTIHDTPAKGLLVTLGFE